MAATSTNVNGWHTGRRRQTEVLTCLPAHAQNGTSEHATSGTPSFCALTTSTRSSIDAVVRRSTVCLSRCSWLGGGGGRAAARGAGPAGRVASGGCRVVGFTGYGAGGGRGAGCAAIPAIRGRSTEVVFYGPTSRPLSVDGVRAAAKLFAGAADLLAHGGDNLCGDQWCIADVDLAL
ncbi:MAG: hypothetical protein IPK02_06945 [Candidatus Accumulibacter sp.]|uniref:Glutathione S-transferases subfamily 4 C-terminal domain-containing protein n=1 Tax=Candidatus Accumulibacter affinis TaxID=2954384 RepID=A0A935W4A3_9PROT|nr:hypothetical protein [Candidatus Accumulibacter affinis]